MSLFLGIDPGPEKSGWVVVDEAGAPVLFGHDDFHGASGKIWSGIADERRRDILEPVVPGISAIAVEEVVNFQRVVNQTVFATAWMSGRWYQAWVEGWLGPLKEDGFDLLMAKRRDALATVTGASLGHEPRVRAWGDAWAGSMWNKGHRAAHLDDALVMAVYAGAGRSATITKRLVEEGFLTGEWEGRK